MVIKAGGDLIADAGFFQQAELSVI